MKKPFEKLIFEWKGTCFHLSNPYNCSILARVSQGYRKKFDTGGNPAFRGCIFHCSRAFRSLRTIPTVVVCSRSGKIPILRLPCRVSPLEVCWSKTRLGQGLSCHSGRDADREPVPVLAGDIPDGLEQEPARLHRIPFATDGNPTNSEPCEVPDKVIGRDNTLLT